MKIKALAECWETQAKGNLMTEKFSFHLSVEDAAKIAALAEMYPKRSKHEIVSELLSAALDELETSLPYVAGKKVVATDEMGDPLYEDVGPTPRFLDLSKKYKATLKRDQKAANG